MPCQPSDLTLNPPNFPGVSIPGLGIATAPFNIPIPGLELPTELLENLFELIEQVQAVFPSGTFKATIDTNFKSVYDIISSILSAIQPFLSFYNFIMAALNLFGCIIEVLCAIPNPFAIAAALKRLFMECLPPFLAIFPWLALIQMLIALLLLIIAIVTYIIEVILKLLADMLKELIDLAKAVQYENADASLAVANKLASLFCLIQNFLAILIAIQAIFAVIESLAAFAGAAICDDSDGNSPCCNSENCPDFIKDNPSGISADSGELIYYSEVAADQSSFPPPLNTLGLNLAPLRVERWQLVDPVVQPYPFRDIITPANIFGKIFYPELSFEADTPLNKAPYLVDIRLQLNPAIFNPLDFGGTRFMRVNDCIVVRKPYIGVLDKDNNLDPVPDTGTLNIEGGLVFEDDNTTPYIVNGSQATLNDFIHQNPINTSSPPPYPDGYQISSVEYVLKPNHGALVEYNLITVGCIPEVSAEKAVTNAVIIAEGIDPIDQRLDPTPDGVFCPSSGFLPNINCALECITDALEKFQGDVSETGTAEFQAKFELCAGDLLDQTKAAYCGAVQKGVSQFKSTVALDTDVQFTTREIKVTVVLNGPTGTSVSENVLESCASEVAKKLKGEVTLGDISDFEYDGYTSYNASISSVNPGSGVLSVLYDNKVLSEVIIGDDDNPAVINELSLAYNFVDDLGVPAPRRDATDVANDGS